MLHKHCGKNQKKIQIDNMKNKWKTTTTWKAGVCKIQTIRLDLLEIATAETKSRQITRTSTKRMSLHRCDCSRGCWPSNGGRDCWWKTRGMAGMPDHPTEWPTGWDSKTTTVRGSAPTPARANSRSTRAPPPHPRACACDHLYWSVVTTDTTDTSSSQTARSTDQDMVSGSCTTRSWSHCGSTASESRQSSPTFQWCVSGAVCSCCVWQKMRLAWCALQTDPATRRRKAAK